MMRDVTAYSHLPYQSMTGGSVLVSNHIEFSAEPRLVADPDSLIRLVCPETGLSPRLFPLPLFSPCVSHTRRERRKHPVPMRGLSLLALLLAGLTTSAVAGPSPSLTAHDQSSSLPRRRKTLGFGPVHQHAEFKSNPYQITTNAFRALPAETDPYVVAQAFLADILGPDAQWFIRRDSYTDKNTGVSHIYVRQIVNGVEVSDGNINLNIKAGIVLSYGNSVTHISNSLIALIC